MVISSCGGWPWHLQHWAGVPLEGKTYKADLPRLMGDILVRPGFVPGKSRRGDSLGEASPERVEGKLCVSWNQSLGLWLLVLRDKVIMLLW